MNLVMKAIEFAAKAHKGQERKTEGLPFITHPYSVGMMLAQAGCRDEVIAAGILHDVWEDTSVELEEIREAFGNEVAKLVEFASEHDKSLSWEERKEHSVEYTKTIPLEGKFVVCADKIHNVQAIVSSMEKNGEEAWSVFKRGKEQQKWYYTSMYESLCYGVEEEERPPLFDVYKELLEKLFGAKA